MGTHVTPKFIICTMQCGEPDFEHCVKAIASQKGVQIDHRIFSHMAELEAHNAVYQTFNEADGSWIRAKIDADVVLLDENVLARVAQRFAELPMAQGIDPVVLDYMTDAELHAGMFFYKAKVKFLLQKDHLYCDRNMIYRPETVWLGGDIGVIGKHMYHCDERTAFRYGFHRGLKRQRNVYENVQIAYQKYQDPIRAVAIKGFELGLTSDRNSNHNYNNL